MAKFKTLHFHLKYATNPRFLTPMPSPCNFSITDRSPIRGRPEIFFSVSKAVIAMLTRRTAL
jgi:hypothetical protein